MNPADTPRSAPDLDHLAARRANAKLGWYIHAAVYLAVKGINKLKRPPAPAPTAAPPPPPRQEVLLEEIRDLLKKG